MAPAIERKNSRTLFIIAWGPEEDNLPDRQERGAGSGGKKEIVVCG